MPTVFEHGNAELSGLVQCPSLPKLIAYFEARFSEWPEPVKNMEFFTVGVFYDLAQSFEGPAAFDLLKSAAAMSIDQMPDKKFLRYIDLLSTLASSSKTAEMPGPLRERWADLIERANQIGSKSTALEHLEEHYRLAEHQSTGPK